MIKVIEIQDLESLLKSNVDFVDVREEDEVAEGMIPGARHLALSDLPEVASTLGQEKPTILYCRSGRRSMKAAELVEPYAKHPLYNLSGGYLAYLEHKQKA